MDGRKIGYVIEKTGPNQLVEDQESGGKSTRLVRDFTAAEMKVTLTVGDVVSTSLFSRKRLTGQRDDWDF
jgi:hypothetical protein